MARLDERTELPWTNLTLGQARRQLTHHHLLQEQMEPDEKHLLTIAEGLLRLLDPDSYGVRREEYLDRTTVPLHSWWLYKRWSSKAGRWFSEAVLQIQTVPYLGSMSAIGVEVLMSRTVFQRQELYAKLNNLTIAEFWRLVGERQLELIS